MLGTKQPPLVYAKHCFMVSLSSYERFCWSAKHSKCKYVIKIKNGCRQIDKHATRSTHSIGFSTISSGINSSKIVPSGFSHTTCLNPWMSMMSPTSSILSFLGFFKRATRFRNLLTKDASSSSNRFSANYAAKLTI